MVINVNIFMKLDLINMYKDIKILMIAMMLKKILILKMIHICQILIQKNPQIIISKKPKNLLMNLTNRIINKKPKLLYLIKIKQKIHMINAKFLN